VWQYETVTVRERGYTLLIIAGFLLSGCRRHTTPSVFVDPALATLVPVDTVFVAGVRVQQLHSTPIYQRYLLQHKLPVIENFSRETGLDVHKDLWEVLMPSDGTTTWVMLRGKFTEMGMEPRVNREGAQRLGHKGYTMLGDERVAVLFLNPTTAVAAPASGLRSIIDNRDKGTGMPSWLQEKVSSISSANQMWFAGKPAGRFPESGPIQQLLQPVSLITGGVDFRSGIDARIELQAQSGLDAQRLRDAVRALVGAARMQTPEDRRDSLRIYDNIHIQNDASRVSIRIEIPADLLDEAIQLIGAG
jgi:hypothetical protein